MAFKLAPRTRQFVTSTGAIGASAVISLGSVTNTDLNSFVSTVGDNNQTVVTVVSGNGIDWQDCFVTVDDASPDTLTVDAIIKSSIAGVVGTSAITLTGTSKVFGIVPTDFNALFDKFFGSTNATLVARIGGAWVGFAPGADGKFISMASGALAWADPPAGATNLDGLTDVIITSPTTNQVISYNGSSFVNAALPSIPTNLDSLTDVIITSPSTGHYIRYNGSNFVNAAFPSIPANLDDLSDVVITSPSTGQYIRHNGTNFVNAAFPSIPANLDDLSDVVITSPSTNQVIAYNGSAFVNATLPAIPTNLDSLTDVVITSPSTGQYVRYNGTNFVNAAFPSIPATLDDLSDTIISSPTAKSYLRYNGTNWVNDDTGYLRSLLIEDENNALGTTVATDNYISSQNGTTAFPFYALRQHGGTKASPTAITNGTVLGAYAFYGWDGSARGLGPTIQAIATENWNGSAHGAKLILSYVPNGGVTPVFFLAIDQSGFTVNGNIGYTQTSSPYSFGFSAPQTTAFTASQVIGHHPALAAFTIGANFAAAFGLTSKAGGTANAAASTVFSVERAVAASPNSFSQIGTITFAAGTVTPTFATGSGTSKSIAAGDVIRIVAPATPDTTFAGFYAAISGSRT